MHQENRKIKNALILVAIFAGLLATGPALSQTLKLTTIVPEGSDWMVKMREGASKIDERTEGRVKIKLYGGGVQGRNARQVQRKMRTGQLHGGVFTAGELAVFQKDAGMYAMALMFNGIDEVRHVRRTFDAELETRLEDAGFVSFGFAGGGFAYLMSNQPISRIEDLNGNKVWTPEGDEVSFAAFKALGIAPVMMPVTDVLTGLQTDLLDSIVAPPVGAIVFQWHTRLKYITDLPVAYTYGALIIDAKSFSRLSEPDQAVVREEFEAIYERFDEGGASENQEALEGLLETGLQMVQPTQGQVPEWREKVVASQLEQAKRGAFDLALFERMRELLTGYRAETRASQASGSP